jgi:hypothetical protein
MENNKSTKLAVEKGCTLDSGHPHCMRRRDVYTPLSPNCRRRKGKHPCVQTVDCIDRDTPSSHFPPVGSKKGYTLKSTLMTVERDTALRPNSWWWREIHPHVYIVDFGKGYTITSISFGGGKGYTLMFTPCRWWKRIHPHVHTLLVVERDTPSCSHPVSG